MTIVQGRFSLGPMDQIEIRTMPVVNKFVRYYKNINIVCFSASVQYTFQAHL